MGAGENIVKNGVLKVLKLFGVEAWLVQSGLVKVRGGYMHLAPNGTSDIVGYLPYTGRILAVEAKEKGKQPRKDQIDFLARVGNAGGVGLVVDDVERFTHQIVQILDEDEKMAKYMQMMV